MHIADIWVYLPQRMLAQLPWYAKFHDFKYKLQQKMTFKSHTYHAIKLGFIRKFQLQSDIYSALKDFTRKLNFTKAK